MNQRKLIILGYTGTLVFPENCFTRSQTPIEGMRSRLDGYQELGWLSAIATNAPPDKPLGEVVDATRHCLTFFPSLEFAVICPISSGECAYLISPKSTNNISNFGLCKGQDWFFWKPRPGMLWFLQQWLCADRVVVVGSSPEDQQAAREAEFEFYPVDTFLAEDFVL